MAKVTSKLQVTIPKAIAERYGIKPGDEIEFRDAGPFIRVIPARQVRERRLSRAERLRLFDEGTARIQQLQKNLRISGEPPAERDWKREDLYERGKPR